MKWTNERIQELRDRYEKDGPAVLAKEWEVTPASVTARARRLGIGSTRKLPPKDFEWTEEMLASIRDRYVAEGGKRLAGEFGVALNTLRRKAASIGLHTIAGHAEAGRERAENSTSCDIRYFDEWSPNMAYVLGFLFADGSVATELTRIDVNIVTDDEEVLYFIREQLKCRSEIRRIPKRERNRPISHLTISSRVLVEGIRRRGVQPRKTYSDDPFPEVPDELMPHFVRGYLDGDGTTCISARGLITVGFVGSPRFIEGIRDSLVRLTGMRTAQVRVQGNVTAYASVAWSALEDIQLFREFAYPEGFGFCLKRKLKNLDDWLASPRWGRGHFFGNKPTGPLI